LKHFTSGKAQVLLKETAVLKRICQRMELVEEVEFWVDKDLFEYWKHAHFTLK
jgi:uncharacterized protein (DUF779 family)